MRFFGAAGVSSIRRRAWVGCVKTDFEVG